MIEIHQNKKIKPIPIIDRTSTTTVDEEQIIIEPQKRCLRAKRRTNDENQHEQEIKKPKLTSGFTQQSDELDSNKKPKPIKQTKKDDKIDSKVKSKTPAVRGRPKKQTVEPPPPTPSPKQESHSPIYATIQRNRSIDRASFATVAVNSPTVQIAPSNEIINTTPKPSTFKRIQSFFRATPTLTNSTKVNRVVQVKNTVVAFGSSTPTNRLPPSIVKTPGPTSSPSIVQKISTPKSKYNLRTRLFNNPIPKDEDENKSQTKKPVRKRK